MTAPVLIWPADQASGFARDGDRWFAFIPVDAAGADGDVAGRFYFMELPPYAAGDPRSYPVDGGHLHVASERWDDEDDLDADDRAWREQRHQTETEAARELTGTLSGRPAIELWRFQDAAAEHQAICRRGGDEDWICRVPADWPQTEHPFWLEEGTPFGCCAVDAHELADGSVLYVGAHA